MKTMQIVIDDDVHQRLRYFALQTKQTMADAARMLFAHCLPPLPGKDEPATDNQADGEVKP